MSSKKMKFWDDLLGEEENIFRKVKERFEGNKTTDMIFK